MVGIFKMITDVQLFFKSQVFWNYISCWSMGGILEIVPIYILSFLHFATQVAQQ